MPNRTFSELALCHLPDAEITLIQSLIDEGMTCAYQNDAGFFIWTGARFLKDSCPKLTWLLARAETDYVLFDVDVEPDPDLEVFDA